MTQIMDAPYIRMAERTGYGYPVTPEPEPLCAVCGGPMDSCRPGGKLCFRCENRADRKLRTFLSGLAPEELEFLDWAVEGRSLVDIARRA